MAGLPPELSGYLAEHLQLVTRQHLLGPLGHPAGQIDGWLRRGHLVEVHRGVYAVPSATPSYERSVYAAVLRSGAAARAGPHSSLRLHAVEGFQVTGLIDVVVPTDHQVRGVAFPVRRTQVPPVDRVRSGGIPALSATRAVIEVAAGTDLRRLRVAIDDIRRRRLGTLGHLRRRAEALPNHAGAKVIRDLLGSGALDHESEAERRLLRPFLAETFPAEAIAWQVTDLVAGRRLDAAIRRLRLGFEYDGKDHHLLPTDREADEFRRVELRTHGVEVVAVTKGMIVNDRAKTKRALQALANRREEELRG